MEFFKSVREDTSTQQYRAKTLPNYRQTLRTSNFGRHGCEVWGKSKYNRVGYLIDMDGNRIKKNVYLSMRTLFFFPTGF